jgi:DNA-binding LacI/PurR family transcriptional regulator
METIRMAVKLKDVAREAGVAVNTASSILNGRKDSWASEETKKRVHDAAEKFGYVPNRLARGLSLGTFNTIGLIIPDLQNPFYTSLISAIEAELFRRDYDLIIEDTRLNFKREQFCLDRIKNRQIDGLIINPINPDIFQSHLTPLQKSGTSIVVLGGPPAGTSFSSVQVDLNESIGNTFKYLAEQGHQRVGFVIHELAPHETETPRIARFKEALASYRLTSGQQWMVQCKPTMNAAYDAFKTFLKNCPPEKRPTALVCLNDLLAVGVIRAATEVGLKIPGDLSIVGVDNIPLAKFLPVSLTTISQPVREMAKSAVEAVLKKTSKPARITLKGELIIRESTGSVRKNS